MFWKLPKVCEPEQLELRRPWKGLEFYSKFKGNPLRLLGFKRHDLISVFKTLLFWRYERASRSGRRKLSWNPAAYSRL